MKKIRMNTHLRLMRLAPRARPALALASAFLVCLSAHAQLPPGFASQFNSVVGSRVEAADILGGDFGLSGGSYSTTGNGTHYADIDVSKFGGGGDVGDPKPLGNTGIGWQPRVQGSMGELTAKNHFDHGPLAGDISE